MKHRSSSVARSYILMFAVCQTDEDSQIPQRSMSELNKDKPFLWGNELGFQPQYWASNVF